MPNQSHDILMVTGPTASGKSALAIALARKANGIVINADSMQMYRDLPIITAQPTADELRQTPHALYGVLDASIRGTAASWASQAAAEIERALSLGLCPILTGGTGFYLKALTQGLSPIPAVPASILADLNEELERKGLAVLRAELAQIDPIIEKKINPGDTQRVTRAIAVWRASGRPLSKWQRQSPRPERKAWTFRMLILMPPRAQLYEKINLRFRHMIASGACEEAARLGARRLDPSLPAMRAHGVPELLAYSKGELALAQAIAHAQQVTRNYAKRQETWIRHQWLTPSAHCDFGFVSTPHVVSAFVPQQQESQIIDMFLAS